MSGIQADISITAAPPGARYLLAGADDGSVTLTATRLTREEAPQVHTKTALENFQSPASGDPFLIEKPIGRNCAHLKCSLSSEAPTATMKRLELTPRGFIRFRAMVRDI